VTRPTAPVATPRPTPSPPTPAAPPVRQPKPTPRQTAALQLTEQGRRHLADREADEAIRVLEQAVNLDPANGRNYFYLCEAFLLKGNRRQAAEFHRLARLYLDNDPAWAKRLADQADRLR